MKRTGLRIYGHRGDPEVKEAIIKFSRWLRQKFEFPVRLPVYLRPERELKNIHGETCSASFFAPFESDFEPYIRIATGAYQDEKRERNRDDALAGYICSLAHEVIHYNQWINGKELTEAGVEEESDSILYEYSLSTDKP